MITPDGRFVVYESSTTGTPTLWKAPIDGGAALQLTRLASTNPALSPDGTHVAFRHRADPSTEGTLGVLRLSDGVLVDDRAFTPPATSRELQWTAGGITYVSAVGGVSNIWVQPLNGDPPSQRTQFTSGGILRHGWSATGRSVIYARGNINNDLVLIRPRR